MEQLMFVAGIPYSGKSYLCERIMERNPLKYQILGIDAMHDELESNPKKFLEFFSRFYPELLQQFGIDLSGAKTMKDSHRLKNYFEESIIKVGGDIFWKMVSQQAVNAYLAYELLHADNKTPVIESLLHDKLTRKMFFESVSEMTELIGSRLDLSEMRKIIIYLNLGVQISLDRYQSDPNQRMIINEKLIRYTHTTQEIPSNGEFQNLEVIILKSEKEISDFADSLS